LCGYTDESVDVALEGGVVALFGVVEMNEEEDVRPDVMLRVDMLLKTLPPLHSTVNLSELLFLSMVYTVYFLIDQTLIIILDQGVIILY